MQKRLLHGPDRCRDYKKSPLRELRALLRPASRQPRFPASQLSNKPQGFERMRMTTIISTTKERQCAPNAKPGLIGHIKKATLLRLRVSATYKERPFNAESILWRNFKKSYYPVIFGHKQSPKRIHSKLGFQPLTKGQKLLMEHYIIHMSQQ